MSVPIVVGNNHLKKDMYLKSVRDINLDHPTVLKVQILRAKCRNPLCPKKSFILPISGVSKYARATDRLKKEALDSIVLDNVSILRASRRMTRSYNTTGSKSSFDRWKQKEADRYEFKEIISQLEFSGILSLDDYKPLRSNSYDLFASDAKTGRILYLETQGVSQGRGKVVKFLETLKGFGLKPWAIVFDLWSAFPKSVQKVFPGILIQYDHFHVMNQIHRYLKNALLQFRRQLKEAGLKDLQEEIWQHKWRLLKNMDRWTLQDHFIIEDLMKVYRGTVVEKILLFKECLFQLFNNVQSRQEAFQKRDELYEQTWWRSSWHLTKVMQLLMSPKFPYMLTYLDYPEIPRAGNSETLIRTWRQIERVRYGFKTQKGKQNHLKLYQIKHYLNDNFTRNTEK